MTWTGHRYLSFYYLKKHFSTSFPPVALVKITAEETGGGIQLNTVRLQKQIRDHFDELQ